MQVVLIMVRNGGERRSFSVVRNLTTIGRREDCDLRIPVNDVSRKHCRLVVTPDNVRVQDLGSSNGTFVNGTKVQDAFLNPGDTVSVGPVNFVVQIDGVPGDADLPTTAPSTIGDTGAGGTALALAALEAQRAEPDAAEIGDLSAVGDLLEPLPDASGAVDEPDDLFAEDAPSALAAGAAEPFDLSEPAAEPIAAAGLPIDALAADDGFDLVQIDDAEPDAPPAPVPPPAPAADADDWDFLIEEPEGDAGHADLNVDLDQPHGH